MQKSDYLSCWDDSQLKEKYKLNKLLGKGTFGLVFKAENRSTGQKVAIKQITKIGQCVYSLRKLVREIILLRKLSEMEKNIYTVKLLDIIIPQSGTGKDDDFDSIFLVMTLGSGDLNKTLNNTPKTILKSLHLKTLLYNQLCCLNFIHSAGIIHRDIKPGNFLVDQYCRVLVCDFGLSRIIPEKVEYDKQFKKVYRSRDKEKMTQFLRDTKPFREKRKRDMSTNVVTRFYRPPEIILTCQNYGQAVDIYSLGMILLETIYCSEDENSRDPEFDPQNRYLIQGGSCFPISPSGQQVEKDDQLIKILENFKVNPEQDFSFISNDLEEKYLQYVNEFAQKNSQSLIERFQNTDGRLINILKQMLEFNPNFRPRASSLLKDKYFDSIRQPENEITAPYKIKVSIDINEFSYDYESEKNHIKDKDALILALKEKVMAEAYKYKFN